MKKASAMKSNLAKILIVSFGALGSAYAAVSEGESTHRHQNVARMPPAAVAVQGSLPKLPADVSDLKFREFFKMPIGPRGLEASEKLVSLAGKRVRLVGYMARQETPTPGMFVFAPLPISLGDEDESLSDDLPASTVFVHIDQSTQFASPKVIPYYGGLLRLTGTLSLGPQEERDGHVSTVRLLLDPELAQAMIPNEIRKSVKKQPSKSEQQAKK